MRRVVCTGDGYAEGSVDQLEEGLLWDVDLGVHLLQQCEVLHKLLGQSCDGVCKVCDSGEYVDGLLGESTSGRTTAIASNCPT